MSKMAETARTPGPWTVDLGDQELASEIWAGDMIVADVYGHVRQGSHADAYLLCAAPELLDACEAAMQCIGELAPTQARVEVAQMLAAAIAKAKGEA